MTRVHAGDGAILAEHAKERRLFLPIQAVPDAGHRGLPVGRGQELLRAQRRRPGRHGARRRLLSSQEGKGQRPQGASTITQQVAKNFLLTNEQTFERKIKEIAARASASRRPTRRTRSSSSTSTKSISGLGHYGIAAAALNYFGKSVHELTIAEAAYLAALPKAPSELHPFRRARAGDRAAQLRHRPHGRQRLYRARPTPRPPRSSRSASLRACCRRTIFVAGYFAEEVRREIAERYGEREALRGRALGAHHARSGHAGHGPQGAASTGSCASTRTRAGTAPCQK